MKSDSFIRTLLIIIVILLALNIILPLLSNPTTSYAAKNIEYKVFLLNDVPGGEGDKEGKESFEKFLNENGKEGWEFTSMTFGSPFLIFKR